MLRLIRKRYAESLQRVILIHMYTILLTLLSLMADHYGTSVTVHILLFYLAVGCAVLAFPKLQAPHLLFYILIFWSGCSIFYLAGGSFPWGILDDIWFWFTL